MAAAGGWAVLNPEDRIDGSQSEVDDTREIQIEDALKLYQNALKLHSQGPDFYDEADAAYVELFQSEIFRSPDAVSQYHEDAEAARHEDLRVMDGTNGTVETVVTAAAATTDESHSSLPQILYLAYKNRGQLTLDIFKRDMDRVRDDPDRLQLFRELTGSAGFKALNDFAEALERDDTDLDLWRKVARISHVLSSRRLGRFCLESVFVGDEGGVDDTDLLGLDEAIAIDDLREATATLEDDLSLQQIPNAHVKNEIYLAMKRRLDPYPYLPTRSPEIDYLDPRTRPLGFQPIQHTLRPANRTWLAVGGAIYQALCGDDQHLYDLGPGASLAIDLPGGLRQSQTPEMELSTAPTTQDSAVDVNGQPSHALPGKADCESQTPEVSKDEAQQRPDHSEKSALEDSDIIDEQAAAQLTDQMASSTPREQKDDETPEKGRPPTEAQQVTLPTRKRSSTSAGIDDQADSGRVKSRRIRAREANAETVIQEEDSANNMAQLYEDRIEAFAHYDRFMFDTAVDILAKCGVEELGTVEEMKVAFTDATRSDVQNKGPEVIAMHDILDSVSSWTEERGHALLSGDGLLGVHGQFSDTQSAGIAMFLEHTRPSHRNAGAEITLPDDEGLDYFVKNVNSDWSYSHDLALQWIQALLLVKRGNGFSDDITVPEQHRSSYMRHNWPPALKQMVVQMMVKEDEYIYQTVRSRVDRLDQRILEASSDGHYEWSEDDQDLTELSQTLYELHLDIYWLITHPNSEVDHETRESQDYRLGRWSTVSTYLVTQYSNQISSRNLHETLILRFLWATTTHANTSEDISQEHHILCLKDLRLILEKAGNPLITLQNNAAMPEISVAAVDQEISRLSTLEFFTSIFSNDTKDPFQVIDSLEPVLDPMHFEPTASYHADNEPDQNADNEKQDRIAELRSFLDQGDASLRFFLWRRLEEAYVSIDFQPQVVSCHLRMMEAIMNEIYGSVHCKKSDNERIIALLGWLLRLDGLMVQLLLKVFNDDSAFESVYYEHLQSSMATVARLCRMLHSFALLDDSLRIGHATVPQVRNSGASRLFENFKNKFREMQLRAWLLQYALIKEGINQNRGSFLTPYDDRARYLRFVHNAMGERGYCRYSNKLLLKIMRADLLSMPTEDDYEPDLSQVLFDLNQLRFSPGIGDVDHDCPAESLDKVTALKLVPFVMMQANRMNIRDLIKSDLKNTIEKVQQVIGSPKSSSALAHNRKILSAYLKSAINQQDLYRSLQGIGELPTKPVRGEFSEIAAHGWYFLQGYIALTKFKSVKRVSPTPTVDIDVATAFFKQDLEHDVEKWETWWRLGQAFEAKVEDDVLWTADKLNNNRSELASLQRNAIHCFAMAIATATRVADESVSTMSKISDLYTEFATLLYSSSREPLSMDAFSLQGFERHYSSDITQQMYKAEPFGKMQPYAVWNFARHLLRRAMIDKPNRWYNNYLLGKCLWKMYTYQQHPSQPTPKSKPTTEAVLSTLVETVNKLPERRDSRAEPILEPHSKLVSVVHKLVHARVISHRRGEDILQATPYAKKEHLSADGEEGVEWEQYILAVLQNLEKADKSNWHHRITARAAKIIYDGGRDQLTAAGALQKFTQHIFTKTMTLQVWKPENERPGRHFVYTSRYVLFLLRILDKLRFSKEYRDLFEPLARRTRRKQGEFLNHQHIWEDLCTNYVRMLRTAGQIAEGCADPIFKGLSVEEFERVSKGLEYWAQSESFENPHVGVVREALELGKLNNSLMKGSLVEDLVIDGYATLYEVYVRQEEVRVAEERRLEAEGVANQPVDLSTNSQQPLAEKFQPMGQLDGEPGHPVSGATRPGLSEQVGGQSGDSSHVAASIEATPKNFWPYPNPIVQQGHPQRASPGPLGNQMFAANPLSVHTSTTSTPPKPHLGRPKTITRREIQRKAQAIMAKPPPIPTPKLLNAPGLPVGRTRVSVEISASPSLQRNASKTDLADEERDQYDRNKAVSADAQLGDKAGDMTSRRSSVGDKWDMGAEADNENGSSELSEIHEDLEENEDTLELQAGRIGRPNGDKQAKLLFPNLVKAEAADSSSVMESEDISMVDAVEQLEEDDEGEPEIGDEGGGEGEAEEQDGGAVVEDSQEPERKDSNRAVGKMPGAWISSQPPMEDG